MKYTSVVCGGTFDRLHTGHQSLLEKAFSVGDHVTIGLTTDEYVKNLKSQNNNAKQIKKIVAYQDRKRILEAWLNDQGWDGRYTIVPIDDSYGPTLLRHAPDGAWLRTGKLPDFDAIVVSSETRKTAEAINTLRKEKGLHALKIIEIPMIPAEDLRSVSSTRVRSGDIDTNGRLILPDNLRPELKKPIGIVISERQLFQVLEKDTGKIVITVGDMTTEKLLTHGVRPTLSIIDFQMKRKPFLWDTELYGKLVQNAVIHEVRSGPGYISRDAIQVIQHWATTIHTPFKGATLQGVHSNLPNTVIIVDGEEDLLVLPVLVEAPIGSIVYYGQPRLDRSQPPTNPIRDSQMRTELHRGGIIQVLVTEKKKQYARVLLHKFITKYDREKN